MQINVGIVGYGNLGKAIEKQLKNQSNYKLIAIFTRKQKENTISTDKILDYKNKIDLLFLCVGSFSDLEVLSLDLIKNFNIIDSYDNHNRLKEHISKIDILAKEHKKIALCSIGWDPGLFSLMRGLFSSLGHTPYSFWGKGTSQGHTQAIKQIAGVVDAIQFTIPNKKTMKQIKNNQISQLNDFHRRLCYVVCHKSEREHIKNEILTMPNYFKGYKTKVRFVSQEKLNKIKSFSHKGEVITKNNTINFSLNLKSNPDFTASVLITYASSFIKLKQEEKFGAHTIFDIPLSYIMKDDKFSIL